MKEPVNETKAAGRRPRKKWAVALELIFLVLLLIGAVLLLRQGYRRYMRAAYPTTYSEIVLPYAKEYGIAPSLIFAVIHTESGFDPDAVSRADAMGLMQLTEDTFEWALSRMPDAPELTTEDLFTPAVNIQYGTYVLKLLGEQFEVEETVLAAYNGGIGNVRRWLEDPACSTDGKTLSHIPYPETSAYVKKVLDAQEMYRELYELE